MFGTDTEILVAGSETPNVSQTSVAAALVQTSPQTLDDLELQGDQIDDCFGL